MIPEILSAGYMAYHFVNATCARSCRRGPPMSPCKDNIDPAGEFRNGTPESIREATLKLMAGVTRHPNFVISSICDIPPMSKWENIYAFFKAAEEFYA